MTETQETETDREEIPLQLHRSTYEEAERQAAERGITIEEHLSQLIETAYED